MVEALFSFNMKVSVVNEPVVHFFDNSLNFTENTLVQKLPPIADFEGNQPVRRFTVNVVSPAGSDVEFSII